MLTAGAAVRAGTPPGLFPVPGDGVLARHGDLILLCSLEDSQAADDLLDLLEQVGRGGRRRPPVHRRDRRTCSSPRSAAEAGSRPARARLSWRSARRALASRSRSAAAPGPTSRPRTAQRGSRPVIRGCCCAGRCARAVSGVRGGLSPGDNGAASTDRFSRLDAGTVRAGGLSYYSDGLTTGRQSGPG